MGKADDFEPDLWLRMKFPELFSRNLLSWDIAFSLKKRILGGDDAQWSSMHSREEVHPTTKVEPDQPNTDTEEVNK